MSFTSQIYFNARRLLFAAQEARADEPAWFIYY
jgi:hypothetical protein